MFVMIYAGFRTGVIMCSNTFSIFQYWTLLYFSRKSFRKFQEPGNFRASPGNFRVTEDFSPSPVFEAVLAFRAFQSEMHQEISGVRKFPAIVRRFPSHRRFFTKSRMSSGTASQSFAVGISGGNFRCPEISDGSPEISELHEQDHRQVRS